MTIADSRHAHLGLRVSITVVNLTMMKKMTMHHNITPSAVTQHCMSGVLFLGVDTLVCRTASP